MMKKLIALVLVLAFAAPAMADDIEEWYAPFRGEPGTTYSQWTYNDPCGVYDWDPAEAWSFVPHPEKEDPDPSLVYGEPAIQVWGNNMRDYSDPCMPWIPSAFGRDGIVDFAFGSWDISNFIHEQPAKDLWVQITYQNPLNPGVSVPWQGDPCEGYFAGAGTWGEGEGDVPWGWTEFPDPCDPCEMVEYEAPLDEYDPCMPDPLYTWMGYPPGEYPDEPWAEAVLVNSQVLPDGWIHEVYAMTLDLNPMHEWFEMGYVTNVLIDQIVIETLCYVPEPATMVLLGLGSLLMIRRKR